MTTAIINSNVQSGNLHQELIDLCKSGDQKAQFQIYKLYYKAMYNTSLRIVNNPMEAEDIMQESFLSAFEKIETYSGTVSFGAWLKRIVVNRSIDSLRKNGKMVFEDIESLNFIEASCTEENNLDEENTERLQLLLNSVKRLPQGSRIVLSLRLLEGFDHDEISEILSISPATSRSQLSRAKQKLINDIGGRY